MEGKSKGPGLKLTDREGTAQLSCLAPLQTISLLLTSLCERSQVQGDHLIGQA